MQAKGFRMQDLLKRKHLIIGIGCISLVAIIGLVALLGSGFLGLRLWQKEWTPQGKTDLRFDAVNVDFHHQADLVNSLPFMAAAAIDVDGDGRDEVFVGGGKNQADAILKFDNGAFINNAGQYKISKEENDATMGAASLDLDNDGQAELVVARESGVWLHRFANGAATSERLPFELAENTTPLSISFGDVNKDGWADIYVSGYIKIDHVEGETIFTGDYGGYSYLFLNNGDNSWTDVSEEAGVFRQHNTFSAVFADLDNDLDSDLVIAQDTGRVEIYENTGAFPFRLIENPSVYSYPMGVAVGDYDNDGFVDLYFSNVGHTLPPALMRGDLPKDADFNPEYMLFHNDGDLKFSDVARDANAAKFGFGWGVVFADMNLDGYEDLMAAQNYARFPANDLLEHYPGKLLQFAPDENKFHPVEVAAGVENKHFGIAPVISDFNGDGWPDLFWANLNEPALAYISKGGEQNWLKVNLPNNASSLNAIIVVELESGEKLTKQLMTSQGLGSDQSRELIFGLGDGSAKNIEVKFQNGEIATFSSPASGSIINVSH